MAEVGVEVGVEVLGHLLEPEQVQVLLGVMPGRDVTPQTASQNADVQDEDQAAASEYKKRQARTNELEFMESLNEHGAVIYQRVLALGNHEGMRVKWATRSFSLTPIHRRDEGRGVVNG